MIIYEKTINNRDISLRYYKDSYLPFKIRYTGWIYNDKFTMGVLFTNINEAFLFLKEKLKEWDSWDSTM